METCLRMGGIAARDVEAGHRWGAFISQVMGCDVEYVRLPPSTWDVEAEVRPLGSLRLCRMACGPHELRCVTGTREGPAARGVAPVSLAAGEWQVCLQLVGEMEIDRGGLHHVLRAGEWGLNAGSRSVQLNQRVATEQLVLIIPRGQVPTDLYAMASWLYGTQDAREGAASLLVQTMRDCQRELHRMPPAAHEAVAQSMLSLLRAALLERAALSDNDLATRTQQVYERAMSFLRAHMADPDLSLDALARALHCSKRYLHLVFQHTGSTPMQALKDLRLEHCSQALRQPHLRHQPVGSIALEAGFRDPAHFGRLFRERYGTTPGDWRRLAAH